MDVGVGKHVPPLVTQRVPITKPAAVEFGPALRDAALAWAAHLALLAVLLLGWSAIVVRDLGHWSWQALYAPWTAWDGVWYTGIARGGYSRLDLAAFFPLYPLLIRATAPLVGGSEEVAGLLLANLACLAAFLVLRLLVEEEFDRRVARRTLLLYVCCPLSIFLAAAYSESLFLLLAAGAALAAHRRRWLLAGACITLATLARSTGVLLLAFPAAAALRLARERAGSGQSRALRDVLFKDLRVRLLAALIAPLLTLAAWEFWLDRHFGVAHATFIALRSVGWQRYPGWPWAPLFQAAGLLLGPLSSEATLELARDLPFILLWIALALVMLAMSVTPRGTTRKLPPGYTLYTWTTLVLTLTLATHTRPFDVLISMPRYMLVVFPCFVLLAIWSLRARWRTIVLVGVSTVLLVAFATFYLAGAFVA